MKKVIRFLGMGVALFLLGGCYINSNGRICSIAGSLTDCDPDAYERAAKPIAMIERWSLSGRTREERLRDWWDCGGSIEGWHNGFWSPNMSTLSAKEIIAENHKVHNATQRCMLRRQYEYIGECPDDDFFRDWPVCLKRAGLAWDMPDAYDNIKRPITFEEALRNKRY
jgi:hypothetical protein